MKIFFSDRTFAKQCSDLKELRRKQGEARAKILRRRLDDIEAADCLQVLKPFGRTHELGNDKKGIFSLNLEGPYRLLFKPIDDPPALKEDGGYDWNTIRSILILGIEDTHGK